MRESEVEELIEILKALESSVRGSRQAIETMLRNKRAEEAVRPT